MHITLILTCYQKHSAGVVLAAEEQLKLSQVPLPPRDHHLKALHDTEYDVLVIGGGATGCGVALDAQSRGTVPAVKGHVFL